MKVKKLSTKSIKPQTPTPPDLKNYNISFLDQSQYPMKEGLVLFYLPNSKPENNLILQLEDSLSKILVQFYPLAGRFFKNDHLVDCSDQGAEFIEAEALDVDLSELVAKAKSSDEFEDVFPDHYYLDDEDPSYPLLSIQVTRFPIDGMAIGISVPHRIMDVCSLDIFIKIWSNACRNIINTDKIVELDFAPLFDLPRLLPHKNMNVVGRMTANKNVLKRFVFNNVALSALKSNTISKERISGVRIVCATIAKAFICLNHETDTYFRISQPINMRERTIPSLPKHAFGNFSFSSITPSVAVSSGIGIEELVDLMGAAIEKSISDRVEILHPGRDGRDIIAIASDNFGKACRDPETNIMTFSDWSKFGFYEADFGWGKPVWVGFGLQKLPISYLTVLFSNKEGDGIEAWVHLNQEDMCCFKQDDDIKLFTT